MMFPSTMVEIVLAGGGLDIDCSKTPVLPDTMVQIAQAAALSGKKPMIIFRNVSILLPDTAKKVAAAGEGCVIFAL